MVNEIVPEPVRSSGFPLALWVLLATGLLAVSRGYELAGVVLALVVVPLGIWLTVGSRKY